MSRGIPDTLGTRWRTAWLPRLLADDWRRSPSPLQQILCFHREHPDAPLHIGPSDGSSYFLPRRLLLLRTPPWTRTSWYALFLLHSHVPEYVMPSRAIQPTSTSRSAFEACTIAIANVNTLLPNETAMDEGLLVPRRAISLAKQFLEASFDVVALQETRTRLAGTIRLPGYTAISTDAGPEAYYGVQFMVSHACLRTRSA